MENENIEKLEETLLALTEQVAYRLRKQELLANVVNVQIKTNDFKTFSHQRKLDEATDSTKYLYKEAKKLLESMNLFDIYRDEKIGHNKKSVAYALRFRDKNKTLQDEEINKIMETIISELEKQLGAELRR